ncbi:probable aspartyl protease At4g16563 [Impatiens glandulifera]|uniref:probable aspartyl protease At4g16563 n=1 Tax=Impatiens glandulifera TaxID=253017 RepID=UPI001FB142CB|nr:probable aspartyl protease At4g16563 [Impatiens glandulifera]
MAFFFLLSILSLHLLNATAATAAAAAAYTLHLSPITAVDRHDLFQKLKFHSSLSITRARHLKRPGNNLTFSPTTFDSQLPILPQSYGGYSVSLSFGTPPQSVDLIMDTGSSLVWLPCTKHYTCSKCNFNNLNPTKIPVFVPKLSSSAKIIGCSNPKCGLIYGSDVVSICKKCITNCTQICPPYMIAYGSGSTSGLLMSDTLHLPGKKAAVDGFVAGCSMFSTHQPSGIAGFGRRPESLPVQMGLTRFSYCLVSHKFDNTAKGSEMVIVSGSDSSKTRNVSYTPLINNSKALNPAFLNYYYMGLRKITVGGRKVKIPHRLVTIGKNGDGGTIIDSGSTFTFMEHEVFLAVAAEFEKQMGDYRRASDVEKWSGLSPCFEIADEESVLFPELVFHFKGGTKMELPLADYFSVVSENGAVCMTIVTDEISPAGNGGPSIILGNYQQQNFYVEYDLENQRLGFRKQIC